MFPLIFMTYQYQLSDLIFTLVLLKAAFQSFQIHQLTTMYHFEHINYGNHYNINIFIMLNHLQSLSIQENSGNIYI